MVTDPSQRRQHAHAFLDRLPADQLSAVTTLLESMLSPLDRALALAPVDDEPLSVENAAAMEASVASLERNGGVPLEEVLADFGLTPEDFRKMGEAPFAEDSEENG